MALHQRKTAKRTAPAPLQPRDWLGRGGLMGFPWLAFPSRLAGLALRARVYVLSAVWLSAATLYFLWQLPLLLLLLIPDDGTIYKRTYYDRLVQPSILAVPFSWCGLRVWTCSPDELQRVPSTGSSVFMTNHSSRIDWLIGLLLGQTVRPRVRVAFVAELSTMLMPIFGWSRGLFGDIFLRRTFHRDAERIRSNIRTFRNAGVDRIMFLAPEGAIVDPGVASDGEYVAQCRQFLSSLNRPPLRYVLTPRYKGMQIVAGHAPREGVFSVTMAFRCRGDGGEDNDVVVEQGKAKGGVLCTRALGDPNRLIPDLHTIFRGGLHVFTHISRVDGDKLRDDSENADVRDTLLDDYQRKDNLLGTFARTGRFDDSQFEQLPVDHGRMNGTLLFMALWTFQAACLWTGLPAAVILRRCFIALCALTGLHAATHLHAERISGASRESLVFETLLKALMQKWMGGRLDHGDGGKNGHDAAMRLAAQVAPVL